MSPILSQIVRLTKSILLHPTSPGKRPSTQFFAGKHSLFTFPVGAVDLSWWYGDDTFHALDAVATLIVQRSTDFKDCDLESVSNVITTTLQQQCIDRDIFDDDAVVFSRHPTLFDCRAAAVPQFATSILDHVESNLRTVIGRRCTVCAVPRFQANSFSLDEESVCLIDKRDLDAWGILSSKGYELSGWAPNRPFVDIRNNGHFAPPNVFECLLVAEERGTQKGSRFNSILRFRKLIAVMFAVVSTRSPRRYHKSIARPFEFCMQFPHASNADNVFIRSDCESIVPCFTCDIPVTQEDVAAIRDWYARSRQCDGDVQGRIEKGAHFLNRGLNADDIEAYINYFVALDALFGERGSVEASILTGVKALGVSAVFSEKAAWLFELRSELVHGGSRYIAEWPKYERYTKHFRSKPMDDVQLLAQLAVLRAPYVFTEAQR